MATQDLEKTIKEIVAGMLSKMGFKGEVETQVTLSEGTEIILCNIKTEDSNFLIGQYGVNLQSLQHIARILVRKKANEKVNFTIDVNSYRQEKNSSIEKLAQEMAQRAMREKRAVVLRPMTPYERRIVHLELSKNDQVKTESVGEGEERKVIIKPANLV